MIGCKMARTAKVLLVGAHDRPASIPGAPIKCIGHYTWLISLERFDDFHEISTQVSEAIFNEEGVSTCMPDSKQLVLEFHSRSELHDDHPVVIAVGTVVENFAPSVA